MCLAGELKPPVPCLCCSLPAHQLLFFRFLEGFFRKTQGGKQHQCPQFNADPLQEDGKEANKHVPGFLRGRQSRHHLRDGMEELQENVTQNNLLNTAFPTSPVVPLSPWGTLAACKSHTLG